MNRLELLGIISLSILPMRAFAGEMDQSSKSPSFVFGPVSGRAFADIYFPTSSEATKTFQQVSGSVWVQADPKWGESLSAHLILTGDGIAQSTAQDSQVIGKLREGYLQYSKPEYDLRAGQLIIPWGKADGINPTDFLTAKNYSFFNPDEEVRRVGGASVFVSWTPNQGTSPFTFTVVETPFIAKSKLLLAPGQIPSYVNLQTDSQTPEVTLSNSETALKAAYTGTLWDLSFSFFRGWNHLPFLQVSDISPSVSGAGGISIGMAQTFQRIKALGTDGSMTSGKWTFREESAYFWTDNNDGLNPLIQPSHLDSVWGVERPLGNLSGWHGEFRIQGQFALKYYPEFLAPNQMGGSSLQQVALNRQIAGINALIQNYQDQVRTAGTLRLSYLSEQDGIDSSLLFMGNLVGGGYVIRPQFTYAWTDSLKTTHGIEYFGGPRDRPLGVLGPYSSLYSEVKWVF